MSPVYTACSITTVQAAFRTRTSPAAGISKVVSCEPYYSALRAMSPTLGTLPMVAGS